MKERRLEEMRKETNEEKTQKYDEERGVFHLSMKVRYRQACVRIEDVAAPCERSRECRLHGEFPRNSACNQSQPRQSLTSSLQLLK